MNAHNANPVSGSISILDACLKLYGPPHRAGHCSLDIGCGERGHALKALRPWFEAIVGADLFPPNQLEPGLATQYLQRDFGRQQKLGGFDFVHSSHVVEHVQNTGTFIENFVGSVKPSGSFCLIWPKPKHEIVGGHVHVFSVGLMLYNLVTAGVDCCNVSMFECGYSLGICGRKEMFELPPDLKYDFGDIEKLSSRFPFDAKHGFDGYRIPGVVSL